MCGPESRMAAMLRPLERALHRGENIAGRPMGQGALGASIAKERTGAAPVTARARALTGAALVLLLAAPVLT